MSPRSAVAAGTSRLAKAEPIPAAAFVDFKKRLAGYEQGQPAEVTADTAAASCNLLPD
jgi:hypothetical protein